VQEDLVQGRALDLALGLRGDIALLLMVRPIRHA